MASTLLGSLLVSLGLESGAFKSGLSDAEKALRASQKRIEAVGKGMVDMGQKLSVSVTAPLVALGAASVKAAMESKDAIGQVNAALASMGNAAGRTSEQLSGMAEGLMKQSLFDDDEILRKVTANLLTFGNVAGEQFDKAQLAAVNLAARMGTDLQSAALMVGKALNDPVKGINALKRAGIQFTEQQQEQIKAMAAAGDMAGAQSLMLKELERQFGGAAKAARDANPFAVLQQSWAEFQEKVGAQLLKALPAISAAIEKVFNAFNSLPDGMQQAVVIAGVLAAALGPLLIVFGAIVSATAPFTAALAAIAGSGGVLAAVSAGFTGLTAAIGPVAIPLAAIAAAGYLIYQNWDKIAPVLQEFWQAVSQTLGPPLMALITAVKQAFSEFWNGPLGEGVRSAVKGLIDFQIAYAKVLGPILLTVLKAALYAMTSLVNAWTNGLQAVSSLMSGDVSGAIKALGALINNVFLGIPGIVGKMVDGVREWLINKLGAVWETVKAKIEVVKKAFYNLYDAVVGHSYIPDMVDGIAEQMKRLDAVMVDPVKSATAKTKDAFRKLAEDVKPLLDELFPESRAANDYASKFAALEAARNGGVLNTGQFSAATERLQSNYLSSQTANDNGEQPTLDISSSVVDLTALNEQFDRLSATLPNFTPQISALSTTFDRLGIDGAELKEDLARSFTDVIMGAKSFGDALRGVFNRLATKILDNMFDNLLGNLLGGIIPGFAGGTNFAPGGMALVGEKGPELVNLPRGSQVIPNNELKGMGNRSEVHSPTFVFPGVQNGRDAREAADQAARRYRQSMQGSLRRAS